MNTKLPPPAPEPDIARIVRDWNDMVKRLEEAEEARRIADQLNIKLIAENEVLRDNLESVNSQLGYYRGFSIEMTTRLSVINQTIAVAVEESRKLAKELPPQKEEPSIIPAPPYHGVKTMLLRNEDGQADQWTEDDRRRIMADRAPPSVVSSADLLPRFGLESTQ